MASMTRNYWKLGQDRKILQTSVGAIRSGSAECGRTGREKSFIFFDFPDWVNVIAVTPEQQVVMISQFRYGSKAQEIEIPGGMIDPGEDPVTAGCRELHEETGYSGKNPVIIGKVCPNPALQDNYCYTVLLEEATKTSEPRQDEMEDISCFLKSHNEVFEMIRHGDITHGLVLNAFMFYQTSLNRT
jgi:8-oxo-dGTP pyrophosphatase MutT (NUDIX family)